jgi:hypothetical protein
LKKGKHIPVLMMITITLISCEKEIDIDLPAPETFVVIDGIIEKDQYARVAVTRSSPYFDTISLATLSAIFINDAVVILSDGIVTDTLTLTIDATEFPPIFYKGNNPDLIGQEWKKYYLTVYANGDTLTSSTTIPGAIPIDSLGWDQFGSNDSLGIGLIYFKEPDTLGNYYYLLCKKPDWQYFVSVDGQDISNDNVVNGTYISFTFFKPQQLPGWFSTAAGVQANTDDPEFFRRGDTITCKLCSIDRTTFEFLRTYEDAAYSFGNPFSAPSFVQTNINGGLGGFLGYGTSYSTYIVP